MSRWLDSSWNPNVWPSVLMLLYCHLSITACRLTKHSPFRIAHILCNFIKIYLCFTSDSPMLDYIAKKKWMHEKWSLTFDLILENSVLKISDLDGSTQSMLQHSKARYVSFFLYFFFDDGWAFPRANVSERRQHSLCNVYAAFANKEELEGL